MLNAGEGDSIVLEYHNSSTSENSYAVIDSCYPKDKRVAPALEKLRELGAEKLAFVCLTHPDADHYKGLHSILEEYEDKIEAFYTFPLQLYNNDTSRLKKLLNEYYNHANNGVSETIKKAAIELVAILTHAHEKFHKKGLWEEPTGYFNQISIKAFSGVKIHCVLPSRRAKGPFLEYIDDDARAVYRNEGNNEVSVVFMLEFAGVKIILGADSTHGNWTLHKRKHSDQGGDDIASSIVKIPHHGSKIDCTNGVLDYLFSQEDDAQKIALISARGSSKHPDEEVLRSLEERGIKPYCTNVAPICTGRIKTYIDSIDLSGLEPEFQKWISTLAVDTEPSKPCQGNVSVTIDPSGAVSVDQQIKTPCPFRGEVADIISLFKDDDKDEEV